MYKRKTTMLHSAIMQKGFQGFIFAIILLLPTFVFADTITQDSSTNYIDSSPGSSDTISYTVSGTHPILFVGLVIRDGDLANGVTFDGISMTQIDKTIWNTGASPNSYEYVYCLVGVTGTHNIVASYSSTPGVRTEFGVESFDGASQTCTPDAFSDTGGDVGSVNPLSATLTSTVSNDWAIMFAASNGVKTADVNTSLVANNQGAGSSALFDTGGAITSAGAFVMSAHNVSASVSGSIWVAFSPYGSTPPSPPSPNVFDAIFGSATSTASSTISIVDNPTQDFANGIFIFLFAGYLIMFYLKKN